MLVGEPAHLVEVDQLRLRVEPVGHDVVELAGEVDRRAVGEVSALVETHAQDGVAGVEQRQVGRHVGLGAAVGLDVGVLGAEE